MPLNVDNRGSGWFGEVGSDWSISATTSPLIVGSGPGRLGSLSFSARCDKTTKFTIDNYVSVQHFLNDRATRYLATFDGYIRQVDPTGGEFATFEMNSIISAVDVERTATNDAAGTYQRSFRLPARQEYTVASTTYTTGGYWTTVGGAQVFVEQDIIIYDVAARGDFVYVLASGGHNGEVVFRMYADGRFQSVWPVYSAADDLGNLSRKIAAAGSYVFVGQVGTIDRVKMFSTSGVFQLQFGATGTADGQFSSIGGIAASEAFNSVFVTDPAQGRVQRFNYSGVYQNKWGTNNPGVGGTDFNRPHGIAVDPHTENVMVADDNARVRSYDSFGNQQDLAIGGTLYFTQFLQDSPLLWGTETAVGVDPFGVLYAFQKGRAHMSVRDANGEYIEPKTPMKTWDAKEVESDNYTYAAAATVDAMTGQIYYARDRNYVEQYAGGLGSLIAHYNYYIALAKPDFNVQYLTMNMPNGFGPYPFTSWEGNVWEHLCDLSAATENAMVAFDERLVVFSRADRSFKLSEDIRVEESPLDSRAVGRYVNVVNNNARRTDGTEVMYDPSYDNYRVFSVGLEDVNYYTVEQNTHPSFVLNPRPATDPAPGYYSIRGANNAIVDPGLWTNHGGKVEARVGDEPGSILLKIVAPGVAPGGIEGPYRFASSGGIPSLTVIGQGVIAKPETYAIGTGVSEEVSNNLVAKNVQSPFLTDAASAYSEGSWIAYNSGTPHQRIRLRMRADKSFTWSDSASGVGGTFQFVNVVIYHEDSEYVIDTVDYTAFGIVLSGYRFNRLGHTTAVGEPTARFEEIWANRTNAEFDGFWSGYTAQDFTIAPLRNPFGINARSL